MNLGDRSYIVATRRPRSWSTRSATSTASRPCSSRTRLDRSPTSSRPTSTTTTCPAAWSWPASSAPTYVVPKGHDYAFDATHGRRRGRLQLRADDLAGAAHPRAHPAPRVLRRASTATTPAVFTGGSLLFGSVGRPDLIGPDATEDLAHASGTRCAARRPRWHDSAAVFPTHGFGSFCSATATVGLESTDRPAGRDQPGGPARRGRVRRRAARRPGRLPGLLHAHGPGQRAGRPARSTCRSAERADPDRAAPTHRRRRVGRRPALAPTCSARATCAAACRFDVRRQRHHLPRLAHPVGHAAHAARRDPGAGHRVPARARRASASTGPRRRTSASPATWAREPDGHRTDRRADFAGAGRGPGRGPRPDPRRRPPPHRVAGRPRPGRPARARCTSSPPGSSEIATWSRRSSARRRRPAVWIYCGSGFRASVAASLLERAGIPWSTSMTVRATPRRPGPHPGRPAPRDDRDGLPD